MALISGVSLVTSRALRSMDDGLQVACAAPAQGPNSVQAVPPVTEPTKSPNLSQQLHPPHAYPALQSRSVIEVDGVPYINDEAVLGDDIVRPAPEEQEPDPAARVEEAIPGKDQDALLPQLLVTVPASNHANPDPRPGAQATPWPESLRILRDLPSQGGRAG